MPQKFNKVLVANRGEIAIRIFRACHDLGLHCVAIYSNEDTNSLFRTKADEAYLVGENQSPLGAYLDIPAIIELAKRHGVDAIHPGYGFLSENAEFAKACEEAGIKFIGPDSYVLANMGDKLAAKAMAIACNVPIIPGGKDPLTGVDEAVAKANEYGYPIILKAAAGGGGRGMRRCDNDADVRREFELVKNEARKAFGNEDIFIEKFLVKPKHIEVQILADEQGHIYHLGERDCSLQRRYQKVVEYAPAWSVPKATVDALREDAVKIARQVSYKNAGTVEFLVDQSTGKHCFIEMNPRIQVEHTVTEMITGMDLVRAQILVAEGYGLDHPMIGLKSQDDLSINGYAIQCRVTTEDPANNFAPDTGKILAFSQTGGYGVRIDGGNADVGTSISPYYDSLLAKITSWDSSFEGACNRALRAVSEVHVRGVKTNIPFITNILSYPDFRHGACHTKIIDDTPELLEVSGNRDRATRILRYIAQIQVDNPSIERHQYDPPRFPYPKLDQPPAGLKQMLDEKGPEAVSKYILGEKRLFITDTTMRDAHQSLFSTRMRTRDMAKAAGGIAEILSPCFSLECWGGATFDAAYRFLYESPWERLRLIRKKIPNIPLQMLLRGSNLVGYSAFPDNLVREFIRVAAEEGIDIFRVFDSLNWMPAMETAMEEVRNQNKFLEATVCYTGDILDPKRDKYTLEYYVKMAKALEKRGANSIAIKDMSGLLKPYAAKKLISTLKQEIGVPLHLHTHDTTANQIAMYLLAAEAGIDIVDCATAAMSSLTSNPSMSAIVASLEGQERDTGLDLREVQRLDNYWSDVRLRYESFDHGLKAPTTDIYRYEIPGGQYTNLYPQVVSLGLGHRFAEIKEMYRTVNIMLGDIVKVTPSSKMVGDLAIFMVQNELTPENIIEKGAGLAFPDSVVSYYKGLMGQPAWGFKPEGLQEVVLKGDKPIDGAPGAQLPPIDFEQKKKEMREFMPEIGINDKSLISYCLFPKPYKDYQKFYQEYGYLTRMGSHVFFNGLSIGETNKVNIEDGKTLVIRYLGLGDKNEKTGTRTVVFELNGTRREVEVPDKSIVVQGRRAVMADPEDKSQIGSGIPGKLSKLSVKPGDQVRENQVVATVEAMKMETAIVARMAGVIDKVLVAEGDDVKGGELLMTIGIL